MFLSACFAHIRAQKMLCIEHHVRAIVNQETLADNLENLKRNLKNARLVAKTTLNSILDTGQPKAFLQG